MTGPAVAGFEAYDQAIPGLLEQGHIPGAAVAVAYRGRIVFARGYGYADRESGRPVQPDTRFRIGSISKPLTAAMVLKLVEEGRLSLEDRVFPLLGYPTPAYAGAYRDPRLDRVTVRQLLNHTGGWDFNTAHNPLTPGQERFDPTSWPWHVAQAMRTASPASGEATVRFMVGQPLQAEPGTIWSYTNFGYLALGRLIEQKTGLGYEESVQQFVGNSYLSGLAIGGTQRDELATDEAVYYDHPNAPLWYLYNQFESSSPGPLAPRPYAWAVRGSDACGGWTASAIEILRLLLALDGLNGTPPLLNPQSIAAMRTATPLSTSLHYGLGWCTSNAANTDPQGTDSGHGGSHFGSTSYALRSADGEWHMVALLNGSVDFSDGAKVNRINTAVSLTLHQLPNFAATPPPHDLTWSTLGWEAWQRRYFGAVGAGPVEDNEHDGLSNLIEYAAGLDPTRADALPPASFQVSPEGTSLLTYRRLILGHPLATVVETSSDGLAWRTAEEGNTPETVLQPDGTLSVTVPVPGAVRARLRVRHVASGVEQSFEPELSPPMTAVAPGGQVTIRAPSSNGARRWRKNGGTLPTVAGASLVLPAVQPADAGIYTTTEGDGTAARTSMVGIVGVRSSAKVTGDGEVVGTDIRHPNGNRYDQVLLTGPAATITADPGKVTRISYVDLTDDIVQVEFSGAGSLTVVLSDASGPALPAKYHQDIRYMKGHATLVVTEADATTNLSAFSIGKANAVNQALFKTDAVYDGIADLAALVIESPCGKAAGLFMGNTQLFAANGVTGIYAPDVNVSGPVRLGNVSAFDQARPMLVFGGLGEILITGGDLKQDNAQPVRVEGLARVTMAAGGKSDGTPLRAQANQARLTKYGADVTASLVRP